MSRDLSAAMLAAITAGTVKPVVFYEGEFSTGTLRLWSGLGDVSWNGQTWNGAGGMLGVSAARETSGIEAVKFSVGLNGESQALLSANLGAVRQGMDGTVWLGAIGADGAVVADPRIMFKGKLDVPDVVDNGQSCTLGVSYESRLIDLERARVRRYTDEDQQIDYPGDRGFEFVPSLQDKQIPWGGA